jgi:hypothetical protein
MAKKTTSKGPDRPPKADMAAEPAGAPEPCQVPVPVVGVGASAGGLEAFKGLLQHLPADTGMAFVLVQHLDPHRQSMLVELLGRQTQMTVSEANDGTRVEPNHVYVIPPDRNLSILHGEWRRTRARRRSASSCREPPPTAPWGSRRSRPRVASPSRRTRRVPSTSACRAARSPRAAWTSSCRRGEIAAELARIAASPLSAQRVHGQPRSCFRQRGAARQGLHGLALAHRHDFTYYKHTTIKRRIKRRMALHKLEHLATTWTTCRHNRRRSDACSMTSPSTSRASSASPRPSRPCARRSSPGCSRGVPRTPRCVSGFPAAPPARRPIRWPSCCWSIWVSTRRLRCRSSAPTSTARPSTRPGPAFTRSGSRQMSRPSGSSASSPRSPAATRSARPCVTCASSRPMT